MFWTDAATLGALVLNAAALILVARQLWTGRRAASAGALIALNESFRQAWLQFTNSADEESKHHAFADIMNLLETACAIFGDKLFVGRSGKLLEDYLCHVFGLIDKSEDRQQRIESIMMTDKTYEHVVAFLKNHRAEVHGFKIPT